jgi:hypothetical protein
MTSCNLVRVAIARRYDENDTPGVARLAWLLLLDILFTNRYNICNRFPLWTPGAAVVRLLLAVQGDELR